MNKLSHIHHLHQIDEKKFYRGIRRIISHTYLFVLLAIYYHCLPLLLIWISLYMLLTGYSVENFAQGNLVNMDKTRQMSEIKRKVRIGVFEQRYLESKCGANNVNHGLAEIHRVETIRGHYD